MSEITLSNINASVGRLTTHSVVDVDDFNKEISRLDKQISDNFSKNYEYSYDLFCSVQDIKKRMNIYELEIEKLHIHNTRMKLLNFTFDILIILILLSHM